MKILAHLAVAALFAVVSAGAQSEDAPGGDAGEKFRDCDACPEMVVVPAGEFMMGSPSSEEGRRDDEGPVHRVRIGKFAVGVYEVTFAEWDACVADGGCGGYRLEDEEDWGSGTPPTPFCWRIAPYRLEDEEDWGSGRRDEGWGRGRRPVIHVGWEDAQSYVRWLSSKTGERYRLLSESEWEYAARAGTTTAYYFGNTISHEQANYRGGPGRTVPVGTYPPNAFGLYDMHGNVWEWVQDCWNGSYRGAPNDGSAWESGDFFRRVLRGGSWVDAPRGLRSASRNGYSGGLRYLDIGFRVARTLTP